MELNISNYLTDINMKEQVKDVSRGYHSLKDVVTVFKEEVENYEFLKFTDKFSDNRIIVTKHIKQALETFKKHGAGYEVPRKYFRDIAAIDDYRSLAPSYTEQTVKNNELLKELLISYARSGNLDHDPKNVVEYFNTITYHYESTI